MSTIVEVVRAAQKVMDLKMEVDRLQAELDQVNERRTNLIARGQAAQAALNTAKADLKAAAAAWT